MTPGSQPGAGSGGALAPGASAPPGDRPRPVLAFAIGTVLALASLEALLWIFSGLAGSVARDAVVGSGPVILCVGDSNTYGVFLEAEDSYPGQLQAFLDGAGQDVTVVNQGYPGLNTAQVRAGLEDSLRELDPVAVVVFAGMNDRWSTAANSVWSEEQPSWLARLLAHSRTVKLIQLTRTADSAAVTTSLGPASSARLPEDRFFYRPKDVGNRESEQTRASIRANLEAITTACRERGTAIVFVGYPLFSEGVQRDVTGAVREAAEALSVPFVDLASRFSEMVDTLGTFLYIPRDAHLSAVGNHEAARQVLLALQAEGVVDVEPLPPPLEEAYEGVGLAFRAERDDLTVDLTGPPGWLWRLQLVIRYEASLPRLLGEEIDPGQVASVRERRAILEPKEFGLTAEERGLWRGAFGADGTAVARVRIPLPPNDEAFRGWELCAFAIPAQGGPHAADGNSRDVRFSPRVPLPR